LNEDDLPDLRMMLNKVVASVRANAPPVPSSTHDRSDIVSSLPPTDAGKFEQSEARRFNDKLIESSFSEEKPKPADIDNGLPQYVTLDQMAAMVNRVKKTLEREMNSHDSDMPEPDVEGGGGKPHEWRWDRIGPWLETKFARPLPKRFPTARPDGH
jgi:hypothetical protein